MARTKELTRTEQGWLTHLRRAQTQGTTLVEYGRSAGVKVGSLYEAKRQLARRGIRIGDSSAGAPADPAGEFIAVRVAPSPVRSAELVCRLRHPSGWEIDCASWPQAAWMAELFGGGSHAAP
jgi:hypothetical protein